MRGRDGVAGPKCRMVNALLASLSRRLPLSNTRVGEGKERAEFSMIINVQAWWEEDRC